MAGLRQARAAGLVQATLGETRNRSCAPGHSRRRLQHNSLVPACKRNLLPPQQGLSLSPRVPSQVSQTLLDALNIARIRPYYGHFTGWVALNKNCECTDDRDRAYALLNLYTSDDPVVQPDYTLSVKEVYTSVVTHFGGLGDLKILQFCDAATSPTWVPDLHNLKDAPGLWISLTSEASASSGAIFNVINGDKVEVAGVLCGIVSKGYNPPAELSDDTVKDTTVQLLKVYLGRDHEQWGQDSLEKFAEAVIGWCAFEQTNAWPNPELSFVVASLRHWAEMWSLVNEQDGTDPIIRLTRLFNRGMQAHESDADDGLRVVSEFVFIQALRQTFKCMMPLQLQDGSIAVGPAECQSGDRLYVILGCPVVLALRGDSQLGYHVLGPCSYRDYTWGQAFYGPLPEGWAAMRDIVTGVVWFVSEDGSKQKYHPRAATRKPVLGWIEEEDDDGCPRWRREDNEASFTTKDPQLTPDVLKGWGVPIEELVLI